MHRPFPRRAVYLLYDYLPFILSHISGNLSISLHLTQFSMMPDNSFKSCIHISLCD
nr:MAG TPA: hypothetical protein [Caudoviricetes sp.]